jgi:para-nitrobenzyl esterase
MPRTLIVCALVMTGGLLLVAAGDEAVKVDGGLIAGSSSNGVRVFKGIPYAAPPTGALRWKAPEPVVAWSGTRSAAEYGAQCLQTPYAQDSPYFSPPRPQSEDCLFLNVWTAASSGARQPVMVWLHGGGLTRGTGATATYDGTTLAKKGAVVVTINYRLGPLGYFSHPELTAESPNHASGNYGALDQIAALKWVQRNIAAFGGDPGRVTIFGESAGSTSVNVLTASPLARGLFHRAIGESGARFSRLTPLAEAEKAGSAFAAAVGAESLSKLRALPGEKLLATQNFQAQNAVDGWVLPQEVRAIYAAKKQNVVPTLVGSNADEMTTLAPPQSVPKTLEEYRKRVTTLYGELAADHDALFPASSDAEVRNAWLASQRDAGMTYQMRTWARAVTTGGARAYLYWFSHVSPHPQAATLGAYHASEIAYVFGNLLRPNWNYTAIDRQLADAMSSYWVNFASSGNPNGKGLTEWQPYNTNDEPYLELGDTVAAKNHLRKAAVDFFEKAQSRPLRSTAQR